MSANYVQPVIDELESLLSDCDARLIDLYALLALTKGSATTLKDVHDAWAVWRNVTHPDHRSLVPFDDLAIDVQEMDRKYMQAIHRAANGGAS